MRFLPAGQDALLIELADLEVTLALFDSLSHRPIEGVEEIVPAARTLLIRYRSDIRAEAIAAAIASRDLSVRERGDNRIVEIPVIYDGADLMEIAEWLGVDAEEVIRRHCAADYTVAFTGFAPGFAYLSAPNSDLDVPRRKVPRTRIPAGAVGLAGPFSGVYPRETPGGWQIIGTTPLVMFDTDREPAALLAPGDRVRFRRVESMPKRSVARATPPSATASPGLRILTVGPSALIEDLGRPGRAAEGVSVSGALDRGALIAANACVGNSSNAAGLEIAFGGLSFAAERDMTIAVAGAPAPVTICTAEGHSIAAPHGRALRLGAGDRVSLGVPRRGMRSYLAIAGGLQVPLALGSAATDTLSGLGPAPVQAGDRLAIGPGPVAAAPAIHAAPEPDLPRAADCTTLDVILGPRTDWFTPDAVGLLATQQWRVSPESSRVGIRLLGERPLERLVPGELPSEGTVRGALQVPPSGQPVMFLSDHPLTGGYPVIGSIAPSHLDLAGQIPIGTRVRLRPIAPFAEILLGSETPS